MVDDIVLKLLAKNPEDRYQTAASVEKDLLTCLSAWEAEGRIDTFELGAEDVPQGLVIPEKLYGRDAEIAVLLAAFENVVSEGSTQLVLVSGYSGIGKSSVVNELHRAMVPTRGWFAAGKFDQYKRDIPYATLAQAFQDLVRQILAKSDRELAHWRDRLRAALGLNAQLMVNLIPNLELVIGRQPPVPRVEPQGEAARFHLVFRNFVGVFAQPEHPLVLFIDDLQWLDAGTLDILQHLVTDPDSRHLMVVGAYRDNEVDDMHPLSSTLTAIRDAGAAVSEVELPPLDVSHLAQLATDALYTNAERTAALAELVTEKTGGNPFFAIQFITALVEEGLITFRPEQSAWEWEIDRIRAKGITDNVADLMAKKLNRLPARGREVLGQLACLGNTADIGMLALVRGTSVDEVNVAVREAVDAGLILLVDDAFTFVHDRVHEAAYALISVAERPAAHLRIGRALLSVTPPAELDERIFEVVNQLERAAPALDSDSERDFVAELNLVAGKRAKSSSAHASARAYFAAGRALLGESSWDRRYALTFDLELQWAECELVMGELAAAEERLIALSQRAVNVGNQASVVCLTVLLCFTTGRYERAVDVALAFLARVGVEWPSRPSEADVRSEYEQMRRLLSARPMETLIDLPPMTDPDHIAVMAVLTELFPAAYAFDRYLLELVLLRMTNMSLEHGNCESSSVAYSALNMALGPNFADYATACALGQLACDLVDRRGMDRYKARVYCCVAGFAMPWTQPVSLTIPMLREAIHAGRSMGDAGFAAYTWRALLTHLLALGTPLGQMQREAEQLFGFVEKLEVGMTTARFVVQLGLIKSLRGVTTENQAADEEWANQDVEQYPSLAGMVCYYWVSRLQERFFAGDCSGAIRAGAHVSPRRWAMRSTFEEIEYDFYAALAHASATDGVSGEQRESHFRSLTDHYERIVIWTENCPENFAHRKALVAAELARIEGRTLDAQSLYDQAVRLARKHGFVHHEGLANELAGQFHAASGLETIADTYLRNARGCYERWGGLRKVKQLDLRYPHLRTHSQTGAASISIDAPVAHLDVRALDKASRTLSSEMALPSLLEKLMRLAVEHAGAERGVLVLLKGDVPHIEAEATTGHGRVEVAIRPATATSATLPQSTLRYVLRSHERVLLDDASTDFPNASDDYLLHNRPKSILCLPIFRETNVVGALYLENNLTTCAFTADKVAVLDFLASQAAIWVENARLYSDLQRSEAWLKEAQNMSSTGSWYWRPASGIVEFSEECCAIHGIDPTQPVTMDLLATRIYPEDAPILNEILEFARDTGRDYDRRFRLQMPDLSVKHVHVVARGSRTPGGDVEYIGALQDITQHVQSEEALGRVRSELAHVARVTSLGVLAASIAHEVNQPLAAIVTNASTCLRMLAAHPPNIQGAQDTARRMIRDGHRASDVITRLRALFARRGDTSEALDLNEATREMIALSWNELQKSRVVMRSELAKDLPKVSGDRVQLQQVIFNLLLNAVEAMQHLDDRPRQLCIRTEPDGNNHIRVSVKDVGIGIDSLSIPKLFEAFYTTKRNGMGIGLSVSRSIIERHRGVLWAMPNDGFGATFGFTLPCDNGEAAVASHSVVATVSDNEFGQDG